MQLRLPMQCAGQSICFHVPCTMQMLYICVAFYLHITPSRFGCWLNQLLTGSVPFGRV